MPNRRYQKIVTTHRGLMPCLEIDVRSTIYDNEESLFYVVLLILRQGETQLDQMRFLHFIDAPQTYEVLSVPDNVNNLTDYFFERMDWIHGNIFNPWSFDIRMAHMSDVTFIWSFEQASDAVLFKLSF